MTAMQINILIFVSEISSRSYTLRPKRNADIKKEVQTNNIRDTLSDYRNTQCERNERMEENCIPKRVLLMRKECWKIYKRMEWLPK
jgi:hypothetical protein